MHVWVHASEGVEHQRPLIVHTLFLTEVFHRQETEPK